MTYTISQIQDAIIAQLRASALAGICPTIDAYHGEIDELVSDVQQLIIPLPAALVVYQTSKFTAEGSSPYLDEQTFSVLLLAKDLSGGDNLKATAYSMIEVLKADGVLKDQQLGLDISPLRLVQIRALRITKTYSIYSVEFSTIFEM